jgi:hypothetical protein
LFILGLNIYAVPLLKLPPDNRLRTLPVTPWAISLLKPAFIGLDTITDGQGNIVECIRYWGRYPFLIGILFILGLNIYAGKEGFLPIL